jgi:peptidoglycan hydrolase-like protein with peptidoglycan-binding domain
MQSVQQRDENEAVFILQGLLYCLGFDPVGFDGSFGKNTLTAVAKYQSEAGLSATGIADAYTWAKMFGFTRPTHTILKKGSKGAEVKYLQRLLGNHGQIVATDGVFGTKTEKAVKAFQAANGLEQDGVVGADTWGKIE